MTTLDALNAKGVKDEATRAQVKIEVWRTFLAELEGELPGSSADSSLKGKAVKYIPKAGEVAIKAASAGSGVLSGASTASSIVVGGSTVATALGTAAAAAAPAALPISIVAALYTAYVTWKLVDRTFELKYLCMEVELKRMKRPDWKTDQRTFEVLQYAVRQYTKRTVRTGAGVVPGVGQVSLLTTIGRSIYKRIKGNIHEKRNRSTATLISQMMDGDAVAWTLAAELLGVKPLLELCSQTDQLYGALYDALNGR